jgi:hypothetical protein
MYRLVILGNSDEKNFPTGLHLASCGPRTGDIAFALVLLSPAAPANDIKDLQLHSDAINILQFVTIASIMDVRHNFFVDKRIPTVGRRCS